MNPPSKNVVCFKCHGHGHYKNECPNSRAFTIQEWREFKKLKDLRLCYFPSMEEKKKCGLRLERRMMMGLIRVNENGVLTRYKTDSEEIKEEERE